MMGSTPDDQNKPVTGYPNTSSYPPPPQTQTSTTTANYQYHQQESAGNPPPAYNSYPASGTAYPYYAPPPAAAAYNNPNSYPPPTNYDAQRSTFLRRVIIAGISFFVLIGLIILILWLVTRARLPKVRVNSCSISNFSVSSSQLSSNWDFEVLFRNPNNKITLFYDQVLSSVNYKDASLTKKELRPFYQKKKTENVLLIPFVASSTYIDRPDARHIVADRSNGELSFNLKMVAWVRYRYGWWMRRHLVGIFCEGDKFVFSSNTTGKLLAGTKECKVYT